MHRIALRSLMDDRSRLLVALVAVSIATLLMLLQAGIYFGFGRGASAPVRWIGGDVWVMSKDTSLVDQGAILRPGADARLRSHPCVVSVRPVIIGWTRYKRATGTLEPIEVIAGDGERNVVPWTLAAGLPGDLDRPSRVTRDILDAPIGAPVEIAGHTVYVGAQTRRIRSDFGLHPLVFASATTARMLMDMRDDESHFWVADLAHADCAASVIAAVEQDPKLTAMRGDDFVDHAEREVLRTSGVGGVLAFIAVLGFVIAVVIVAQTLVASLHEHRRELAMLKALGATRGELVSFVAWQVGAIALVGVATGTGLVFAARPLLANLSVEVVMRPGVVVAGIVAMLVLCTLASFGTVRSVLRLEADEVLR